MAAGLGLKEEDIEAFKIALNKEAEKIPAADYIPQEETLGILDSTNIDFETLDILEQFEPYGEANSRPRFLIQDARIISIRRMGQEKEHAKIELLLDPNDSITYDLVYFRCDEDLHVGNKITCSYTLNKNVWNNKASIQFMLDKVF